MFETLLDAFAEVTGCDRVALSALVEPEVVECAAAERLGRIAAAERLVAAAQAVQLRDLASYNANELAAGDRSAWGGDRDPELAYASRVAAVEVAKACRVAVRTAGSRIESATRAVADHPALLEQLGSGAVSLAGLRGVLEATRVLDSARTRDVDRRLATDAVVRSLTPGELRRAAERRVLAADADAAAERVRSARRRRSVRLADPVDGTAAVFVVLRAEEALAVFSRLDTTARAMRSDGDERSLDTLRADLLVMCLLGQNLVRIDQQGTGAPTDVRQADSVRPPVWRSKDGVEPAFDQADREPPLWVDPDPPPDDPAWDGYAPPPAPPRDPVTAFEPVKAYESPPEPDPPTQWRLRADVEVQVVVSLATVLGLDDQPGLLRGYGAIPAETIRRIVDVAGATGAATTMRRLFCDPTDGRLLAMESTADHFTGGLRKFGCWRDQVDRLTGGPIGDLDHVQDRAAGGTTTAANCQGLGVLNNRVVKNHSDVRARVLPVDERTDGLDRFRANAPDIEWTLPSGNTYVSRPAPALGLGSEPHEAPLPAAPSVHPPVAEKCW